ncbi:SH3 domain-containing kinase-binding protein 1 isoform X2 [Hippoglossus hippoglossus]|uniref:SH3 domain-containing kinase-binding protein 1 isoform X2 n=1 Tax=Hippoglossus hippoglossus TaxID=8267 RepID=UPI00148BEC6E|nr:SH3 domain-containing kinase-binding protein 1 isoform X2 [Hippoglossus hippoglossus]XP_034998089.2 SH3 domain-containing kinase-binding protein 1 isoform X2 [Hippoglossus stenolepis]
MVEAVVEFDYEAQQDDELGLTVGDIIVNIRRDDGGWWEGELGGRRGLFPDNFVREIKKEGKRDGGQASMIRSDLANGRASPVSDPGVRPGRKGEQIRKRRCKAAFSYVPQHEDELELKIGDVIDIITEVEEGWWEGLLHGKTGMFPSNFTRVVVAESDTDTATSQEELRSSRSSKDSPGSESDGGDSRSETGSGEIVPKKVRGFGFGDIFKDQPIKLRPRSMEIDSEGDKVNEGKAASVAPETMKTEPDNKTKGREQCKVLFPYDGQNEDELSIKEGEIVNIITKECADAGWWMGEIGGRQGVFPDNFVKLLEVEKERPRKPPPPSAPSAKNTTGEEAKVGDIPKPSLPSHLPKKPLPPKTSSSPASLPPRRPERPPPVACESPKSEGGASTPDSAPDRSHETDADLDAVLPAAEKLSHPTVTRPRVTDRRPRSQIISASSLSSIDLDPPAVEDRKEKERGKDEPGAVPVRSVDVSLRKGIPPIPAPDGKAPLPAKPSVLTPPNTALRPISPSSSSGLSPSPELRHSPLTPLTVEELRNQLRDLRTSVELLKSQHRQEMKQLSSALDEEKKIRLSLQMEVEHIKKNLMK